MRSTRLTKKERRFFSIAIALLFSTLTTTFSYAAPSAERPIDVVAVNWPGSRAVTVTVDQVEQSIKEYVAPNWRSFTTSQGGTTTTAINFVPGIISLEPIALTRPMPCEGSASVSFMTLVQREFYRSQKISNYDNRYLIILSPEAGCAWQGKAPLGSPTSDGGVLTLHNTASGFVITHELGHTFGLGHSNFLYCSDGARDGNWSNVCKSLEYGGTIDVMGNVETTSPLSTYHQWRMGLIDSANIYQSWVTEDINLSASDVAGPTRAIFLRDGKVSYWIEYRRGGDSYKPGLAIYRTDPPPNSSIVSPNAVSSSSPEYTSEVASDIWMLNWDTYSYNNQRTAATGSMTLPEGKTATVFSGNISITASATQDPSIVKVSIKRSADRTPPPTPAFSNPLSWQSADTDIVIKGKQDGESQIAYFELRVNGVISRVAQNTVKSWLPTYLNPLKPMPSIYVRDLPEGSYRLAIRSADVWGNISPWSAEQSVTIDRKAPKATSTFKIQRVMGDKVEIQWTGAKDADSGLCSTTLANEDGWIVHRSSQRQNPTFTLPSNGNLVFDSSLFDCYGNGVRGTFDYSARSLSHVSGSTRVGKWSTQSNGRLRCSGRCSFSLSVSGSIAVELSSGEALPSISSRIYGKITSTKPGLFQIGELPKFMKIQGSNFTISQILSVEIAIRDLQTTQRKPVVVDGSLLQSDQKILSKMGFNPSDFSDSWTVEPMERGTTLADPTLDLCSASFTSESDRVSRRQMMVTREGSPYEFLSSEVVKYANPLAASNALAELKATYQLCRQAGGGISSAGIFTPYNFHDIPEFLEGFIQESGTLVIRATYGALGEERQLVAVYQFKGSFFTGLYLVKVGPKKFDDIEVSRWLNVAIILARRIQSN